jgi:hypothetical protein
MKLTTSIASLLSDILKIKKRLDDDNNKLFTCSNNKFRFRSKICLALHCGSVKSTLDEVECDLILLLL